MNYKNKYFKYKLKYLKTKQLYGGTITNPDIDEDEYYIAVSLKFVYRNNTMEDFFNVFTVSKNILIEDLIEMVKEAEQYKTFEEYNYDNKELIQIVLKNDGFINILDNHTEKKLEELIEDKKNIAISIFIRLPLLLINPN